MDDDTEIDDDPHLPWLPRDRNLLERRERLIQLHGGAGEARLNQEARFAHLVLGDTSSAIDIWRMALNRTEEHFRGIGHRTGSADLLWEPGGEVPDASPPRPSEALDNSLAEQLLLRSRQRRAALSQARGHRELNLGRRDTQPADEPPSSTPPAPPSPQFDPRIEKQELDSLRAELEEVKRELVAAQITIRSQAASFEARDQARAADLARAATKDVQQRTSVEEALTALRIAVRDEVGVDYEGFDLAEPIEMLRSHCHALTMRLGDLEADGSAVHARLAAAVSDLDAAQGEVAEERHRAAAAEAELTESVQRAARFEAMLATAMHSLSRSDEALDVAAENSRSMSVEHDRVLGELAAALTELSDAKRTHEALLTTLGRTLRPRHLRRLDLDSSEVNRT